MLSLENLNWIRRNRFLYGIIVWLRDKSSRYNSIKAGSFSQDGEDLFVFERFGKKNNGRYLDIGASHPFRISNTYLLYLNGWSGITVEPIPKLAELHKKWRPRDRLVRSAVGREEGKLTFFEMTPSVLSTLDRATADAYLAQGRAVVFREYTIDVVTLDVILAEAFSGGHVDFLSIDIEGLDAEIFENVDLDRWRPSVICIEANDHESRLRIMRKFQGEGYVVIREMGGNIIAVSDL